MITRCRPLLGTFVEVTVPAAQTAAIDHAFAAIEHVHRCMSFHDPDSDLGLIRAAPAGATITLDPETVKVLHFALELYGHSGGLFDVTVGRALVRTGFLPRAGIDHLAAFTGNSADIAIIAADRIRIARRVIIDLGGIAKGHAVDQAVAALQAAGAAEGLVNAGGDLRAFGDRDWTAELRDADDIVRSAIIVRNAALASSANLSGRRRLRGQTYSPHFSSGGQPVLCDHRVSVIAPSCILADGMTKIALADPALAQRLLKRYGGHLLPVPDQEPN